VESRSRWKVFDDGGKYIDRFGLVLVLTAFSISVLSLVDLDDPREQLRSAVGWLLVSFTVGITLLVALRASGVRRRWLRIADVVIGLTLVVALLSFASSAFIDLDLPFDFSRPSVVWVVVAMISPIVVLRRVLSQSVVTVQTLFGALSVYLLMAIAFNYMFLEVQRLSPTPFFGSPESTSSFMYFSIVTITTLGYGDLAAASDFGRYLATSEAIIGQVFLVTIVARLVSLYSRSPDHQTAEGVESRQKLD